MKARLYVVVQLSTRTGTWCRSEQQMSELDAMLWAEQLRARPENRYLTFWVEPAGLQSQPKGCAA